MELEVAQMLQPIEVLRLIHCQLPELQTTLVQQKSIVQLHQLVLQLLAQTVILGQMEHRL
jgi:hypothetical protein